MRRFKWPGITILSLFLLAAIALRADFRAGYYAPTEPGAMRQALPDVFSTDANYSAGQFPLLEPALATGDGKETLEADCSLCHTPRFVTMQPPLPAETWAAEVEKMRKVMGASIPDDDAKKIVEYLSAHYTPETRKR
ncbi:MAG: cytochrome c [Acidobacteriia bacterium]|nr:cytochrome c [Terriglobia bacterium]